MDEIEIGKVYKLDTNYIILMTKHPKYYKKIYILTEPFIHLKKIYHLTSIVNVGSNLFPIGTTLQVNKVVIEYPEQFSLDNREIEGKKY